MSSAARRPPESEAKTSAVGVATSTAMRQVVERPEWGHRLIETFLLECLGYSWEAVHEEAESLEHSVSDEFTERLAEFLGHPDHDPHGDPIPTADGTLEQDDSFPLSAATTGQRAHIYRVGDEEGWQRPPDEGDNATWKLLWVLVGAVTFTMIMFFLDLI